MEFDQNRQFLGQCEFPLEIKKKISDFDKKSGSDGVRLLYCVGLLTVYMNILHGEYFKK